MAELFSVEWWQIIIGGVSTLAVFSFLYRENPVFRLFEHFYIGIATAIGIMTVVKSFAWPKVFKPLLGLDLTLFPDGSYLQPYDTTNLIYIVPMLFGLLYYFILSPKYAWLAQLVIGFSLGIAGGLAFKGVFNEMLPQVYDSFRPLVVTNSWSESLSNLIFVFSLITAMIYFLLTFNWAPGSSMPKLARAGRWMMMGCFGSFFGATIMARMALLVERLEFLINNWRFALLQLLG